MLFDGRDEFEPLPCASVELEVTYERNNTK